MKVLFEVGILLRRQFRALLWQNNIDFKEDKGIIGSTFYINATEEQREWLKQLHEANN